MIVVMLSAQSSSKEITNTVGVDGRETYYKLICKKNFLVKMLHKDLCNSENHWGHSNIAENTNCHQQSNKPKTRDSINYTK